MGGVAVLNPQDLLNHHHHLHHKHRPNLLSPAMKSQSGGRPNLGSGLPRSSNRRKRIPQKTAIPTPLKEMNTTIKHSTDLVMGQVRILKRGDALPGLLTPKDDDAPRKQKEKGKEAEDKKVKKVGVPVGRGLEDLVLLSSTVRLGPEPEAVPKQIRVSDFYAGSGFVASPPPSSLPLPAFFKKKDVATSDLIKLLRLDLS